MVDTIKFTVLLDPEERAMLEELASADGRSSANWIRVIVRREHAKLKPAAEARARRASSKRAK